MATRLRYVSEKKAWSDGQALEFTGFIPHIGPNGGRVIIRTLHLYMDYVMTIATAAIQGEDLWRLFGKFELVKATGGTRWKLFGDQCRIAAYAWMPKGAVPESPDIAIGAGTAGTWAIPIPVAKPRMRDGEDFAMPADDFGKAVITSMGANDLDIGTSDVTFTSGSYYIWAECYEEVGKVKFYLDDYVKSDDLQSQAQTVLTGLDGKLQDLLIHARGASGGASLANFTDVTIDEPERLLQKTKRTELLHEYRVRTRNASNGTSAQGAEVTVDPFVQGTAVAIFLHDEFTSCWDGPYVERLKLDMTNTVTLAGSRVISRVVKPRDKDAANAQAVAHGVTGGVEVATAGKTHRSLGNFDKKLQPYLPMEAPVGDGKVKA